MQHLEPRFELSVENIPISRLLSIVLCVVCEWIKSVVFYCTSKPEAFVMQQQEPRTHTSFTRHCHLQVENHVSGRRRPNQLG